MAHDGFSVVNADGLATLADADKEHGNGASSRSRYRAVVAARVSTRAVALVPSTRARPTAPLT
jgi:hypothetical protein